MKKATKSMTRSVVSFYAFLSFCFCTSIKMAKKAMKSMKKKGSMKKATKSMKKKGTMKRRKAMKVSKIAKGKRAKSSVFRGRKAKTSGGLKKQDLIKSKSGKVVSKKMSDRAKLAFKKNGLAKWFLEESGKGPFKLDIFLFPQEKKLLRIPPVSGHLFFLGIVVFFSRKVALYPS